MTLSHEVVGPWEFPWMPQDDHSMLCCPSGRNFKDQRQKVPPNGESLLDDFPVRRCSHPWERSSRCGRSWSQVRVLLTQAVLLLIVKIYTMA